ncbi:phosphoglycerate mutase-like protein [Rickenella mellea]|uniref:Phosphoglycerate mutase-like protein n=1 Tax=Rickenella mellea TaxID=50990 RepID=A0A4Y7Q4K4_9AGAM|nr:phosphoglycerate mutase-like protein [Rickenella mellea]
MTGCLLYRYHIASLLPTSTKQLAVKLMASSADSVVLGVVLLVRHGDRQGFYQNPLTYTASNTEITPLGNAQEFQLGTLLRNLYLDASSPSFVQGISTSGFNQSQVLIRADAGGEGGVIFDSAVALTQGLWPPTSSANVTLANGTTVISPLGGYQYVPIESVEPNEDVSLEGWTSCSPFDQATSQFYNSSIFQARQNASQALFDILPPYLDGRAVNLQNIWNIFDYMNVQFIHNATFAANLPPTLLAQVRELANFHEYGVFTSAQLGGIGNIGGRTILPSIINSFSRIVNASDPLKFVVEEISYKPFLSLFNMTDLAQTNPQLTAIVDYASVGAFEVRQSSDGSQFIRFNFKNGTSDANSTTYGLFGGTQDIPLAEFVSNLEPVAINSTKQWCSVCQNNVSRGCADIAVAPATLASMHHQPISPVGAGFLGAGLTAIAFAALLTAMLLLGMLSLRRGNRSATKTTLGDRNGADNEMNQSGSIKSLVKE